MHDTKRLSWLRVPDAEELPPEVLELWRPSLEKLGFVPNVLRLYALRPSRLLAWNAWYEEAMKGGLEAHGFEVQGVKLDLAKMLARKDKVVKSLTTGIAGLFKKNKVTRYQGHARIAGEGKVVIQGPEGEEDVHAAHILIATGSAVSSSSV